MSEINKSEKLWSLIRGEIIRAMAMEKQPEPENPMLGENTGIKTTYRIFEKMKELGFNVELPVLESTPTKPIASVPEGKGIIESIVGAPKVVFEGTLSKVKSGIGKIGQVFHVTAPEETNKEG